MNLLSTYILIPLLSLLGNCSKSLQQLLVVLGNSTKTIIHPPSRLWSLEVEFISNKQLLFKFLIFFSQVEKEGRNKLSFLLHFKRLVCCYYINLLVPSSFMFYPVRVLLLYIIVFLRFIFILWSSLLVSELPS